jgi:hypothetical protein
VLFGFYEERGGMSEQPEWAQLKMRIRRELRDRLEKSRNSTSPALSINAEVEYRLENSFKDETEIARLREENRELILTMRRMADSFDEALNAIRPDPTKAYRDAAKSARTREPVA